MKKLLQLIVACACIFNLASCGGGGGSSSSSSAATCSSGSSANSGSSSVTALSYVDNTIGTGPAAIAGNSIAVNYTGYLYESSAANDEGAEFGSSSGIPYQFTLGAGTVIAGWDQGLVGMKAGGTRTLIIPSSLAYGSCAPVGSNIPPDSALVFSVTLVSIGS
jgi:FKBP-type peptidyl-prolyl cis-trans isomerase FkpA